MHTAPATNASFANVPSPGPSAAMQGSSKGTSAKQSQGQFQQVYQNVSASNDGGTSDQAASKNASAKKKDSAQQSANAVVTSTPPASQSNPAPLSSTLALTASSIAQPDGGQVVQGDLRDSASTQSVDPGSDSANLISVTQAIAQTAEIATQKAAAKTAAQTYPADGPTLALPLLSPDSRTSTAEQTQSAASVAVATSAPPPQTQSVRPVQLLRTFPPVLDLSSVDQTSSSSTPSQQGMESQKNSNASTQAPLPNAPGAKPLALSTDNLAFSLNVLTKADAAAVPTPSAPVARPIVDAKSTESAAQPVASTQSPAESDNPPVAASVVAQSYAITDDAKLPIASATDGSTTAARSLPSVTSAPNESRSQVSPDSSPRQQQDSTAYSSSQRASSDASNQDSGDHAQSGASDKDSTSDLNQNAASNTNRPAQPSVTSWLAADQQSDARPAIGTPSRPTTAESTLPASIQDLHAVAADAPKTTAPSEILLHLDNGQTSAAVRVVDRAGTVNVSVHASDQDLRTSLRTNLNDLSAQLNAQGVKTESTRTASSQGSSENRQDQGTQDQRSNGQQQHSSPQGDRQSPRGRRASAQWLNELQEQTSPIANPGGNQA